MTQGTEDSNPAGEPEGSGNTGGRRESSGAQSTPRSRNCGKNHVNDRPAGSDPTDENRAPEANGSHVPDGDTADTTGGLAELRALIGAPSAPDAPDAADATDSRGEGRGTGGLSGRGAPVGPGDEDALRALLQQAVQDLEPRTGSLEHLRRTVPVRIARRRQAFVGAAAALLFLGTAVPAAVHVTKSSDGPDRTAVAGHGEQIHGGTGEGDGADGSGTRPGSGPSAPGGAGEDSKGKGEDGKGDDGKGSAAPSPDSTMAANSPSCTAEGLGGVATELGAPDADGAVYGTFRVANVSDASCTVEGPGSVTAVAEGAAVPSRVSVLDHTSGDAATGLPDPAAEAGQLVLVPGATYKVQFAWVPSEGCQSGGSDSGGGDGGAGEPTPDPTPSDGGVEAERSGPETQLRTGDGDGSGSVAVSHTAEPGAPSTGATISGACAGTLYRTGVLPG